MTQLLEKAFKEASKLPDLEQNRLARWLLDELLAEQKWDALFAESEMGKVIFKYEFSS